MKYWLMFISSGVIWGSSFLLTNLGVRELSPLEFVTGRLLVASACFLTVMAVLRRGLPQDPRTLGFLFVLGITNTVLPFGLITWAQQYIDSGLAGVLNATVPLFSTVIAHFALPDEKMNPLKLTGLLIGLAGIALLSLRGLDPSRPNPIEGQLAMLGATLCYASSAVFIRRYLRNVTPFTISSGSMLGGTLVITVVTLIFQRPLQNPATLSAGVIASVIALGTIHTFVANTMMFSVLAKWGPSRATTVTYLPPPISLFLGAALNNERLDWQVFAGAALILGGVIVANWRKRANVAQSSTVTEQLREKPTAASD